MSHESLNRHDCFQIAWSRSGVSVGHVDRVAVLGYLYGAALAASLAEETVVRVSYKVGPSRHTAKRFEYGTLTIECDDSDVFRGGPIHRGRELRARSAAYAFLMRHIEARRS